MPSYVALLEYDRRHGWRGPIGHVNSIPEGEGEQLDGLVDEFSARGLKCFGPSKKAAQLEGSKAYTKEFLRRHRIPTASYSTFTRETFDREYIRRQRTPIVVKASGYFDPSPHTACEQFENDSTFFAKGSCD